MALYDALLLFLEWNSGRQIIEDKEKNEAILGAGGTGLLVFPRAAGGWWSFTVNVYIDA